MIRALLLTSVLSVDASVYHTTETPKRDEPRIMRSTIKEDVSLAELKDRTDKLLRRLESPSERAAVVPPSPPTAAPRLVTVQKPKQSAQYPVHPQRWSVRGSWNPSREQVLQHLLSDPNHSGRFDRQWLSSLSREQLLSLHDDHHDGRVSARQPVRQSSSSPCPTGVCPLNR